MSTALVHAVPRAVPSLGRQWIAAHVAAQIVCFVAAGAAYGLGTLVGATDPAAGATLKQAAFALGLATELIYGVAFAALRGAVLRRVLPQFPMRLWLAAVVGYVLLFGLLSGLSPSSAVPKALPQLSSAFLAFGLMTTAILGAVKGLVVGTVEGLVLRRVADGALSWVLCTMAAWSAGLAMVFAAGGLMLALPGLSPTALLALGIACKLATGLVVGALTLPALKALRSRGPIGR